MMMGMEPVVERPTGRRDSPVTSDARSALEPRPLGRRPTQADVAQLAGVSASTVSHILSGRRDRNGSGAPETRARVEAAIRELGYQPNFAARALRRRSTGVVAALGAFPSNLWEQRIMERAQENLARRGVDLVGMPRSSDLIMARFLDLLERRGADAALIFPCDDLTHAERLRLADSGVPLMGLGDVAHENFLLGAHHYADRQRAMLTAMLERGIRKLCMVIEGHATRGASRVQFLDSMLEVLAQREAAAPGALQVHCAVVERRIIPREQDMEQIPLEGHDEDDPLLVVCQSDQVAIQVLARARALRVAVPGSVGIVGRGNTAEGAEMGLSTFGADSDAYMALIDQLADMALTGQVRTGTVDLGWRFIERESTAGLTTGRRGVYSAT